MAALQKGLGRGLGALFQDDVQEREKEENTSSLPIGSIVPNPKQPRQDFDDNALADLAESIKSQGVLQPILVRVVEGARPPRYEIVAGERRWRASKLAGLAEVPVVIRDLSEQDALAIALIENLQREDLNALEEALGISELKEKFGMSQEQLSQTLGKSRSAIANILRLLNLSEKAQAALRSGSISAGHARAILAVADLPVQNALLEAIIKDGLTVREAEAWAAMHKMEEQPAQNEETAQEADKQPAKKLPQSAIILELQKKLSESVGLPVRFSGKENRGKISISYSSRAELELLLQKIGLNLEF